MRKIIYVSLLLFLSVACVKRAPIPESKLDYVGTWYKDNGCWLKILENGRGDFQMENSYVDGGAVSITEDEIAIKFLVLTVFGELTNHLIKRMGIG